MREATAHYKFCMIDTGALVHVVEQKSSPECYSSVMISIHLRNLEKCHFPHPFHSLGENFFVLKFKIQSSAQKACTRSLSFGGSLSPFVLRLNIRWGYSATLYSPTSSEYFQILLLPCLYFALIWSYEGEAQGMREIIWRSNQLCKQLTFTRQPSHFIFLFLKYVKTVPMYSECLWHSVGMHVSSSFVVPFSNSLIVQMSPFLLHSCFNVW